MKGIEKRADRLGAAMDEAFTQGLGGTALGAVGGLLEEDGGMLESGSRGGTQSLRKGMLGGAIVGERPEDRSEIAHSALAGGVGKGTINTLKNLKKEPKEILESGAQGAGSGALEGALERYISQKLVG